MDQLGAFEFEKKTKPSDPLKIDPGAHKKLGVLNVIKQLQHFILCNNCIIRFTRYIVINI